MGRRTPAHSDELLVYRRPCRTQVGHQGKHGGQETVVIGYEESPQVGCVAGEVLRFGHETREPGLPVRDREC